MSNYEDVVELHLSVHLYRHIFREHSYCETVLYLSKNRLGVRVSERDGQQYWLEEILKREIFEQCFGEGVKICMKLEEG